MPEMIYEPDFPANEFELRFKKLKELMRSNNLNAVLVTEEANLTYFAGFRKMTPLGTKIRSYLLQFCLLPLDGDPVLLLPLMDRGNAESWSWIEDRRFFNTEDPLAMVADLLSEMSLDGGRLGMEIGMNMRVDLYTEDYQSLKKRLPNVNFIDASSIIWELRSVKSDLEIECLQKSCDIAQAAMLSGLQSIRIGMTEKELLTQLYKGGLDAGAADLPLKLYFWIRSGPSRYLMRDSRPSAKKKLERGDLVVIDGGVGYKGYMSDFIRNACLGQPDREQRKMYDLAMESQTAALQNIRAGNNAADPSIKSLEVFKAGGYGANLFSKQIAHGIGLEIHEFPFITTDSSSTIFKTGNVLCVEPFIYDTISLRYMTSGVIESGIAEGIFIIEDEIAVTDVGIRNLTPMEKDLYVVKS